MKRIIQGISLVEIIAGLAGLCVTLPLFLRSAAGSGFSYLHLIMAVLVVVWSLFSLVSGITLWRGSRLGFRLSIILQVMQIPRFTLAKIQYSLYSIVSGGVEMDVKSSGTVFRTFLDGGPGFDLGYGFPAQTLSLGVNLVALGTLILLWKTIKTDQELRLS